MHTTSNLAAIGLVSHAVNELRYGIDVQDCSIHVDHGRKMVVINGKAIDAAFVAKVRELRTAYLKDGTMLRESICNLINMLPPETP